MPEVYDRAVALVIREIVDVKVVVGHRFDLASASEAFTFATSRQGLKVLMTP